MDDGPKIKGDVGGGNEIIVFGCSMVVPHNCDPKSLSLPNLMMRNQFLRMGIQDHIRTMIFG